MIKEILVKVVFCDGCKNEMGTEKELTGLTRWPPYYYSCSKCNSQHLCINCSYVLEGVKLCKDCYAVQTAKSST